MTDDNGTFEHAKLALPRRSHGYCADDVARVLLVAAKEPTPSAEVALLARRSLEFLSEAMSQRGGVTNRRDASGRWRGPPCVEDCWGRTLWALGAAVRTGDDWLAPRAIDLFECGATRRSSWLRATAFSVLGAADVLGVLPENAAARGLLGNSLHMFRRGSPTKDWPWPEPRLSYANAAIPDALMAAGEALDKPELIERGISLLEWLLEREIHQGHLSVTPVGGAGPGDPSGRFDQQPIEVAAMAAASTRAFELSADRRWADAVQLCLGWFEGDNDAGTPMWDRTTGGGYDGLHAHGPNLNEGAESTLALIATRQCALSLLPNAA
jgi:hypothetical protein